MLVQPARAHAEVVLQLGPVVSRPAHLQPPHECLIVARDPLALREGRAAERAALRAAGLLGPAVVEDRHLVRREPHAPAPLARALGRVVRALEDLAQLGEEQVVLELDLGIPLVLQLHLLRLVLDVRVRAFLLLGHTVVHLAPLVVDLGSHPLYPREVARLVLTLLATV